MDLTFRQYFETTAPKPSDYLTAVQDELGIDPEVLKASPQVVSNFKLGDTYNLGAFSIIGYEYNDRGEPTMAKVQMNAGPSDRLVRRYKTVDGQMVKVPKGTAPDNKVYLIPVSKLNTMLTQPFAQQPAAGGM